MTDESLPDPQRYEPNESDETLDFEDELDAILADAVSLASVVGREVGEPEAPASGVVTGPLDGVDSQVAELDSLLAQTTAHVQGDSAANTDVEESETPDTDMSEPAVVPDLATPPTEPPSPPSPGDSAPLDEKVAATLPDAETIPDFMDELTRPEEGSESGADGISNEPAEAESAASTPGPAADAGAIGASDQPVHDLGEASDNPLEADIEGVLEELEGAEDTSRPVSASMSHAIRLLRRLYFTVEPLAAVVCNRVVGLLEVLNRPLERVGEFPRRAVGWVAVATMGTAVIVLIVSLL